VDRHPDAIEHARVHKKIHHNPVATMTVRSLLAVASAALLLVRSNALSMTTPADSRRAFLHKVSAATAAVATGLTGMPTPSLAVTGVQKSNAKLSRYYLD
jgi:hypothetical protein